MKRRKLGTILDLVTSSTLISEDWRMSLNPSSVGLKNYLFEYKIVKPDEAERVAEIYQHTIDERNGNSE